MEHLVPARWQWHALLATLGPVNRATSMAKWQKRLVETEGVSQMARTRRCQAPKTNFILFGVPIILTHPTPNFLAKHMPVWSSPCFGAQWTIASECRR